MKKLPVTILFVLISFTISSQQFVDSETPVNTNPVNNDIGTGWILDFSDEFNGTSVNENKWNVDNSPNTHVIPDRISRFHSGSGDHKMLR